MKLPYSLYVVLFPLLFGLIQTAAPDLPPVFSVDIFAALFYCLTILTHPPSLFPICKRGGKQARTLRCRIPHDTKPSRRSIPPML